MSDKLPMPDVEKTSLRIDVSALTKVRLQRIADGAGLSMNSYANALIEAGLKSVPTTDEDRIRADEIIKENIRKRAENKAKKGIR